MIELCLHIKIYLDYFPGKLKYGKLGKSMHLPTTKVVEIIQ